MKALMSHGGLFMQVDHTDGPAGEMENVGHANREGLEMVRVEREPLILRTPVEYFAQLGSSVNLSALKPLPSHQQAMPQSAFTPYQPHSPNRPHAPERKLTSNLP